MPIKVEQDTKEPSMEDDVFDIDTPVQPTQPTTVTTSPPNTNDMMAAMQAFAKVFASGQVDETKIRQIINEEMKKFVRARTLKVVIAGNVTGDIPGIKHKALATIIKMVSNKVNVMMVGPPGVGKTTIANQVAKAMSLPFYFNGAIASEYKLAGFIDAQGKIVSTPFRKAFESGGVYLFDEVDASLPSALLAFNAALSNEMADFPDGRIERHKDFYCLAAANTYGLGADRMFVGRNQIDAATLDRFAVVDVDCDEEMEKLITQNDAWFQRVVTIRKAVNSLKIRHIVSPRASYYGAALLAAGLPQNTVEESLIWRSMEGDTRKRVLNEIDGK